MHHLTTNYSSRLFQLFIGITFLFFFALPSNAQVTDTTKIKPNYHSPRKATIYSTVLPGLGQIYNKKYWKAPLIYAAAGGLIYSFQFNQSHYVKYRDAYKYRIDNDPSTVDNYVGKYSDSNLDELQKYYHRYRDLTVIGFAALYIINIVDATVDAHLFRFDVSDDLSLNIHPTLINNTASFNHYTTGFSLNITF
jgi:hypothetical protein